MVFNLPPTTTSLPADAGNPPSGKIPQGAVQGRTDFGKPGYGGPCPPQGDKPHRYVFTVYALKTDKLDTDENASAAMVGFMMLTGRMNWRFGATVIIGCFILFGAGTIVAGIQSAAH